MNTRPVEEKVAKATDEARAILEKIARQAELEIMAAVVADMWGGGNRAELNTTPNLRFFSQNLLKSYSQLANPQHVSTLVFSKSPMGLKLYTGSRALTPGGFPYAWRHETVPVRGILRNHLQRGLIEWQQSGGEQRTAIRLAEAMAAALA